jgi:8-oxo-dGTP diphosphatase
MKTIEVVAAVIKNQEGLTLAVQRGESSKEYISKKWEFPGGKIEAGETLQEALQRELVEELKIEASVGELVTIVDHTYPDFRLIMHAFHCQILSGELTLTEHLDKKWLPKSELRRLDWAAADVPIVDLLV